jgi:hypothetical protein
VEAPITLIFGTDIRSSKHSGLLFLKKKMDPGASSSSPDDGRDMTTSTQSLMQRTLPFTSKRKRKPLEVRLARASPASAISFCPILCPGRRTQKVVAHGRVVKPGSIVTVCQGEVLAIKDEGEKICAIMQATMLSRPMK